MYGILLENLAEFVREQWGEGKWESIRRHAGVDTIAFSTHHVYSETVMQRLAKSACQILGVDEKYLFEALGVHFIKYVSQYGYDKVLSVLGRQLRDFLNGLDNLHEYLKFSYPKMRAPSFYCDQETAFGLKLHYRSKRRGGLIFYVMGQIKQVASMFYSQSCEITIVSEEVDGDTMHVVFDLAFDNSVFIEAIREQENMQGDARTPVEASTIFELFPFCIVFNSNMEIKRTGHAVTLVLKHLIGQIMTDVFDLTRPMVPFCFTEILGRRNNLFELLTIAPIQESQPYLNLSTSVSDNIDDDDVPEGARLRLKGQMLHMPGTSIDDNPPETNSPIQNRKI